jgi:hypothetical protein
LLPNDKLSVANFHFRVLFGAALEMAAQTDQTQRIDPAELQKLKASEGPMLDSAADQPIIEVHRNVLPDVYPEEK